MNRRIFLKRTAQAALALPVLFGAGSCLGPSGKSSKQMVRFGLCADVHKDIMHDADSRLETFIDRMNTEKVDFIMQLGDFCRPYDYNQGFLDIFNQFNGPVYHVLGNHDMDGGFTREQTLKYWSVENKYYSFDLNGYHFVVLDGNDKKKNAAPGYARYIGPPQSDWIKNDLAKTNLPTLIFSHQGIGPATYIGSGIENNKEIQAIFEKANEKAGFRKVVACFNGHDHLDAHTINQGIHYVQINSMSNQWLGGNYRRVRFSKEIEEKYPWVSYTSPYKDSLYAIVTLQDNGVIGIEGVQSQWIPPSPFEIIPPSERIDYIKISTPEISDRQLKVL